MVKISFEDRKAVYNYLHQHYPKSVKYALKADVEIPKLSNKTRTEHKLCKELQKEINAYNTSLINTISGHHFVREAYQHLLYHYVEEKNFNLDGSWRNYLTQSFVNFEQEEVVQEELGPTLDPVASDIRDRLDMILEESSTSNEAKMILSQLREWINETFPHEPD